jgi:TolB-like protein
VASACGAVVIGIAILAAILVSQRIDKSAVEPPPSPAATTMNSIAVLPFVDMSPGKDQGYLADGISEEILNRLAQAENLRVIARTSSFALRDPSLDVTEIAKRLNVTHVLEGSVRKSGENIRITAQLISASNSSHVWSET